MFMLNELWCNVGCCVLSCRARTIDGLQQDVQALSALSMSSSGGADSACCCEMRVFVYKWLLYALMF